eukprot:CAMPEP_0198585830 /NCGR_PEP_ID=MMETSP1462-20131121/129842_1 /TAXON_ID=1333877 /ORGANISM="Brandtodinium nutriculum, Strain RCC3387" /LENGTH=525 /DNA_ID=CAMNT_0044317273 /DNA_START=1 /DNA_END=1575 /DNA_ORIENTATION=+
MRRAPSQDREGIPAQETDPLWKDKEGDCGLSVAWSELRLGVGDGLLWVLFFVQHLMRGFVGNITASAKPYIYKAYHVPATRVQIYDAVAMLPWALKPITGLVSDVFPLFGYRKAPYILMASLLGAAGYATVGYLQPSALPLALFVGCLFCQSLQLATSDILVEACYAERIQQTPKIGPSLLTFVWLGMSIAELLSTGAFGAILEFGGEDDTRFRIVFAIVAFPAILMMIPILRGGLQERPVGSEELLEIRARFAKDREACFLCALMLVCITVLFSCTAASSSIPLNFAVSLVIFFVVLAAFSLVLSPVIAKFNAFSLIQASLSLRTSGAGFYFFIDQEAEYPEGPHFSEFFYSTTLRAIGAVCSIVGIATYYRYARRCSFKMLLLWANIAGAIFSCTDVLMYSRVSRDVLKIPDTVFVITSLVLESTMATWQWMPQTVIFSYLCPRGMEATMYALLAGCHNLGNAISAHFGAMLLHALGCEPRGAAGESAQFDNLWKASMVSILTPLLVIVALFNLIPDVAQGER